MRLPFLAVILVAIQFPLQSLAASPTIYQCKDASGGTVVANTRIDKSCKALPSRPADFQHLIGKPKEDAQKELGIPAKILKASKASGTTEEWLYSNMKVVIVNGKITEVYSEE